jgi:hypothetical protein
MHVYGRTGQHVGYQKEQAGTQRVCATISRRSRCTGSTGLPDCHATVGIPHPGVAATGAVPCRIVDRPCVTARQRSAATCDCTRVARWRAVLTCMKANKSA